MLDSLIIANFKSIKRLEMNLQKLNILVGPNSSGKTSFLQSIALMKQSTEKLQFNGEWVNLGTFKDVSFNHEKNATIEISFSIQPRNKYRLNFLPGRGLVCHIGIQSDANKRPFVARSLIYADDRCIIDYEKDRQKYSDAAREKNYLNLYQDLAISILK